MRRAGLLAIAVLALAAAGTAVVRAHTTSSRMLVYAQEWTLYGSRASVPAGKVSVQLWNRGEDPHDLHIRRLSRSGHMVGRTQKVKKTSSGSLSTARWKLKPGTYELYCSLPGHLKRGMHMRLTVR